MIAASGTQAESISKSSGSAPTAISRSTNHPPRSIPGPGWSNWRRERGRTTRDSLASAADVPTHAITQGLGTIFEARQLLLIAHGEGKADAVARAVEGPVTEDFPASLIQRHPRATLVLDEAAASRLQPSVLAHAAVGAGRREC